MKRCRHLSVKSNRPVLNAVRAAASLAAVAIAARWGIAPTAAFADTNILSGTTLNIPGPTLVDNDRILINSDNGGSPTIASVNNSMTWNGNGSVFLNAVGNIPTRAQIISPMSGVTLTIGSGQTIHGNGIIAVGGLINNGNILADVAGSTLAISTTGFTNNANLTVTNTATPFPKVEQYIDAAYNLSGIAGDYNGRGGITSSVAKTNVSFIGVGYYNGALQDPANPDNVGQILGPNANSGTGTGIPLTQILVRPTLTGDLNGDGVVNSYDVNLFNSFGLFNQSTNLGYQAGDLNGDGVVNSKDVTIFNSAGNFNNGSYLAVTAAAKAASTLTGRSASPATAELNPASGTMAFSYDPATGDVKVKYNGFTGFAGKQTFNTTNRALSLIDILSTGGAFALDSTHLTPEAKLALSSTTFTGNTEINLTAVNGYLPDGTDLGKILAPGLDPQQLAGALTLTFNYTGSRQLSGGVAGLIVPEPTTLSLLGLGAMGLLARRRRTNKAKVMN